MKRFTLLPGFVRLRRCNRGTLVTEFAVVLPLMTIFMFGFIGLGQLLWYHSMITAGVRDGTRFLSRNPYFNPADPTAGASATAVADAKTIAMRGVLDGGSMFYFWTDPASIAVTAVSVANPASAFREVGAVPVVQMRAQVLVSLPVLGFGLLGLNPSITYTVTDQARFIGR